MENSIKDFNDALCEVRKAHRLIYTYQSRITDLAYFIKSKLDFPAFLGDKFFSSQIHKKRNGYLEIFPEMWAWDFMYSYDFEFYLGDIELPNKDKYALSILHYSDTGFFEKEDCVKTDIHSFEDVYKSGSKLLFFLELKPASTEWIWDIQKIANNKEFGSIEHTSKVLRREKGVLQVIYSFPLERFINEKSTLIALNEFSDFCKKRIGLEIPVL